MGERALWGFEDRGRIADVGAVAEGGRCYCRESRRRAFWRPRMGAAGMGAPAGEPVRTSGGRRVRAPACGWRRGEAALRGGTRGVGHDVSILIRLGEGDRAGRGAFERLDDDHPAAAAGAAARRRNGFGLAVGLGVRALGAASARRAPGGRARCCRLGPRRRRGRSVGCGGSRSAARAGESGG